MQRFLFSSLGSSARNVLSDGGAKILRASCPIGAAGPSAMRVPMKFQFQNARGRGGPPPRGGMPPQRFGGAPPEFNEPMLVAKLLEHFPEEKTWIPISKWMHDLPEQLQEPISRFGGLGKFATSQANFFIVRKENNINVVALTPMAMELCREKAKIAKDREKRNAKMNQRRGRGGGRGSFGGGGGRGNGAAGRGRGTFGGNPRGNFGSGRRY